MSGVSVNDECVDMYNTIKMGPKDKPKLRHILFKIKDKKEIVLDSAAEKVAESTTWWEDFKTALDTAKEPRYALIDCDYESTDGRPQSKLCFVFYSPDEGAVQQRMLYASSKDAIKKKFPGIMKEVQANDMGDLEWDEVLKKLQA